MPKFMWSFESKHVALVSVFSFFVCNHVTVHPNDGQSNNLWVIFLLSESLQQEKLNGNSTFES